jgi:hypothetical protein
MARARRLRGVLLRLVLNRPLAIGLGCIVAAPGALLLARDFRWENGITDGLALLSLATGAAIIWTGLTGRKPDWVE